MRLLYLKEVSPGVRLFNIESRHGGVDGREVEGAGGGEADGQQVRHLAPAGRAGEQQLELQLEHLGQRLGQHLQQSALVEDQVVNCGSLHLKAGALDDDAPTVQKVEHHLGVEEAALRCLDQELLELHLRVFLHVSAGLRSYVALYGWAALNSPPDVLRHVLLHPPVPEPGVQTHLQPGKLAGQQFQPCAHLF